MSFKKLLSVLLVAGMGFAALSACDLEEDKNKTPGGNNNNQEPGGGGGGGGNQTKPSEKYEYIYIEGMNSEKESTKTDTGADIDAIVVKTKSGKTLTAASIVSASAEGQKKEINWAKTKDKASSAYQSPKAIEGSPDAIYQYGTATGDFKCRLVALEGSAKRTVETAQGWAFVQTYYSMGESGHVLAKMSGKFGVGDMVNVVEVSNCKIETASDDKLIGKDTTKRSEKFKVRAYAGSDLNGTFVELGEADTKDKGPIFSFEITQ